MDRLSYSRDLLTEDCKISDNCVDLISRDALALLLKPVFYHRLHRIGLIDRARYFTVTTLTIPHYRSWISVQTFNTLWFTQTRGIREIRVITRFVPLIKLAVTEMPHH